MTWQPLTRVPDPVQQALVDAVRASIMPVDTHAGVSRAEDDMLAVDLADGRRIRVTFRTVAKSAEKFGARDAVRFDMQGRAIVGKAGLGLAAHAVVDIKTQAFLDVSCEIRWRDGDGR
jgi:hypothetical protein